MELRHDTGMVFDDERRILNLEEELKIIEEVLTKVRRDNGLDE